jgi:hypothetical protein
MEMNKPVGIKLRSKGCKIMGASIKALISIPDDPIVA